MEPTLHILVEKAKKGNRKALEQLILEVKDLVYNLSLRMLLFPEDAEDATQEILVKVITHLSTFRGESVFQTWVYRIATNYLLTVKGKKGKEFSMDFNSYGTLIDDGHSDTIRYSENKGEQLLLEEEVKVSCTHGMLLCLNESGRMVYILGELLGFTSIEGAEILGITPVSFRKKLSRARAKLRSFLSAKCGLANPANPCRCRKKVDHLIAKKLVNPKGLRFAVQKERSIDLMRTIDTLEKSASIFRTTPQFATPESVIQKMKETIQLL